MSVAPLLETPLWSVAGMEITLLLAVPLPASMATLPADSARVCVPLIELLLASVELKFKSVKVGSVVFPPQVTPAFSPIRLYP